MIYNKENLKGSKILMGLLLLPIVYGAGNGTSTAPPPTAMEQLETAQLEAVAGNIDKSFENSGHYRPAAIVAPGAAKSSLPTLQRRELKASKKAANDDSDGSIFPGKRIYDSNGYWTESPARARFKDRLIGVFTISCLVAFVACVVGFAGAASPIVVGLAIGGWALAGAAMLTHMHLGG